MNPLADARGSSRGRKKGRRVEVRARRCPPSRPDEKQLAAALPRREAEDGGEGAGGGGGGGLGVAPTKDEEVRSKKQKDDEDDIPSRKSENHTKQNKKKRERWPDDDRLLALQKALWHKKTGGGYRLFASYYLRQPPGVAIVADDDDDDDVGYDDDAATKEKKSAASEGSSEEEFLPVSSTRPAPPAPAEEEERGMSRASVRRRRRHNSNKRRRVAMTAAGGTATRPDRETTAAGTDPPSSLLGAAGKDGDGTEEDRLRRRRALHGAVDDTTTTSSSSRHRTAEKGNDLLFIHPLMVALRDLTSEEEEAVGAALGAAGRGPSGSFHNHDAFFRALARPLPVSFRIRRGVDGEREHLLRSDLEGFVKAGVLRPVPGLSGADTSFAPLVYQSAPATAAGITVLSKSNLKASCPELKRFLNDWCLRGGIARQEVGSMLPVLLLQSAGHLPGGPCQPKEWGGVRVLDLCASPGSKTLQAAELLLLLGRGAARMVRANDVHPQRLEALQDAVRRSGIPDVESVLKYSQIDATQFPVPASESKKYDVVICDVPCSGDGTCRKDRHLLPNWTPRIGNALHPTQVRILKRALRLVRVGGAVSYSTCSLNPVENEAVVSAAMARASLEAPTAKFELVRLPALEGFVLRPGVSTWKVADSVTLESDEESEGQVLRWHRSYEDAVRAGMDDAVPTLWPPDLLETQHVTQHLDRCRRLLPQDQDTGGFFVAIIRRVA